MGQCAYREYKKVEWQHCHPGEQHILYHVVHVLHCATCGKPVICHAISGDPGGQGNRQETIYPSGPPARDPAPGELRSDHKELADDYDEAVACEPHSLQAATFLLGRCVERILVDTAGVNRGATLGVQINEAIKADRVPERLKKPLKNGLLIARNQAGHVWQNAVGDDLKVDGKTVKRCFVIVKQLFDHFYLEPLKADTFTQEMRDLEDEKA